MQQNSTTEQVNDHCSMRRYANLYNRPSTLKFNHQMHNENNTERKDMGLHIDFNATL